MVYFDATIDIGVLRFLKTRFVDSVNSQIQSHIGK